MIKRELERIVQSSCALRTCLRQGRIQLRPIRGERLRQRQPRHAIEIENKQLILHLTRADKLLARRDYIFHLVRHATAVVDNEAYRRRAIFGLKDLDRLLTSIFINMK